MSNQRLVIGLLGAGGRSLRASNDQCRFQPLNVLWQRFNAVTHARMESQKELFGAAFLQPQTIFRGLSYPALYGRQVCCGLRQSSASSR